MAGDKGYTYKDDGSEVIVVMPIASSVKGKDVDYVLKAKTLRLGIKGSPDPVIDEELCAFIQRRKTEGGAPTDF